MTTFDRSELRLIAQAVARHGWAGERDGYARLYGKVSSALEEPADETGTVRVTVRHDRCPDCYQDTLRIDPEGLLKPYTYTPLVELPAGLVGRLLAAQTQHTAAVAELRELMGSDPADWEPTAVDDWLDEHRVDPPPRRTSA